MRKLIFVSLLCCLTATTAFAIIAAEEWIDIPVVVNIVDDSDSSNVDAAIKKANDILKQAKVRLVVKKTNNNVVVGNGTAVLTEDEAFEALQAGQEELNDVCGAGKGLKITIADNVLMEVPGAIGWSIHRNPVIFIEPDADVNEMAKTIAHEMCHSLTVNGHSGDVNDLMHAFAGSGTTISPDDITEIRTTARRRGEAYFVMPKILPGQSVATPPGILYSIDAHGAILDGFYDQIIIDPTGTITGPNDPTITYTDLREITLFADEPFEPNSFITLEIQLGGLIPELYPVDSFFDVFFDITAANPGPEFVLSIQLQNTNVVHAEIYDPFDITAPPIPVDTVVHRNDRFDVNSTYAVPNNHSLEVQIPIELIELNLIGIEPITVGLESQFFDYRAPSDLIQSQDSTTDTSIYLIVRDHIFGLINSCPPPILVFSGGSEDTDETCGDVEGCFRWNLLGCGFTPGGDVEIEIDGVTTTIGIANADGCLVVTNISSGMSDGVRQELPLPPSYHWVIAKEVDDSGPQGAKHAIGFFAYIPNGKIIGDEDWDGDVDFVDFSWFANNWLLGTE